MNLRLCLFLALVLVVSGCTQQASTDQPTENTSETPSPENSSTPQTTDTEGLIQEGSTLEYSMTEEGETNSFTFEVQQVQNGIVQLQVTEDFGYSDSPFNYTYDMDNQRPTMDSSKKTEGFLRNHVATTFPFMFRPFGPSNGQITEEKQQKITDLMENGRNIGLDGRNFQSIGETQYNQINAREIQIGDLSYLVSKQEPYIALRFPAEGTRDGDVLKLQTEN